MYGEDVQGRNVRIPPLTVRGIFIRLAAEITGSYQTVAILTYAYSLRVPDRSFVCPSVRQLQTR